MAGRKKRAAFAFLANLRADIARREWWERNGRYLSWENVRADIRRRFLATFQGGRVVDGNPLTDDHELRFEWRGNAVHVSLSRAEVKAEPAWAVDEAVRRAGALRGMPCRHVRTKQRHVMPEPRPVFDINAAVDRTASVRIAIVCDDCGVEVRGDR